MLLLGAEQLAMTRGIHSMTPGSDHHLTQPYWFTSDFVSIQRGRRIRVANSWKMMDKLCVESLVLRGELNEKGDYLKVKGILKKYLSVRTVTTVYSPTTKTDI